MREVCRNHGVLFIADEVITGFGRTGELFASDLYEVEPDIMTMAKGLSSAYLPIGATATTNEIFEALNAEGDSGFLQINTYGGHPAACAASLKNLEIMMDEELPARAKKVGAYLGGLLGKLADIPCVGDIRGVGLIWGVELIEESGGADLHGGHGEGAGLRQGGGRNFRQERRHRRRPVEHRHHQPAAGPDRRRSRARSVRSRRRLAPRSGGERGMRR